MKVLQITTTVNSGSVGRIAEDIGKVLLANGHESYIAFGRGNHPSQSKLIKIGNQLDVYKHVLKTATLDRHGFGSKRATIKLIKKIEHLEPDVIGLHTVHGYYLNIKVLFEYIAKKDIPIVWTFHDCWAFTGHCSYFDSINCEKWKTQCQQCPKSRFYPSSYFIDNSKKNYSDKKRLFNIPGKIHIVTPSIWLQKLVENSFLKHPVTTINNGIDIQVFQPGSADNKALLKKYKITDKKIILGVANIWDKRKGLNDFIRLRKLLPENLEIVLVGLSVKQTKILPNGITGIKHTENIEELASFYSISECFINPTYQDNFPTTNLEALACGTPVITYNTGGSPEAINEQTGIVVEKGDINGLASETEKIVKRGKKHYLGLCRSRAENYFNKDDRYVDYLNSYTNILSLNH